jgi:hypothetical protein
MYLILKKITPLSLFTFIYTHCWELMNSVGSHGSSSLPFMMKVMVCHFVSDSHEVMTALIVVLPLIVVMEISLQLYRSFPFYIVKFFLCFSPLPFSLFGFFWFFLELVSIMAFSFLIMMTSFPKVFYVTIE